MQSEITHHDELVQESPRTPPQALVRSETLTRNDKDGNDVDVPKRARGRALVRVGVSEYMGAYPHRPIEIAIATKVLRQFPQGL